mgnify:CR=1 FL=1
MAFPTHIPPAQNNARGHTVGLQGGRNKPLSARLSGNNQKTSLFLIQPVCDIESVWLEAGSQIHSW